MISGGLKIPSVLYYDQQGKVRAVGAEALLEDIYERAEDEMWQGGGGTWILDIQLHYKLGGPRPTPPLL
jgi:hypothetical protein